MLRVEPYANAEPPQATRGTVRCRSSLIPAPSSIRAATLPNARFRSSSAHPVRVSTPPISTAGILSRMYMAPGIVGGRDGGACIAGSLRMILNRHGSGQAGERGAVPPDDRPHAKDVRSDGKRTSVNKGRKSAQKQLRRTEKRRATSGRRGRRGCGKRPAPRRFPSAATMESASAPGRSPSRARKWRTWGTSYSEPCPTRPTSPSTNTTSSMNPGVSVRSARLRAIKRMSDERRKLIIPTTSAIDASARSVDSESMQSFGKRTVSRRNEAQKIECVPRTIAIH